MSTPLTSRTARGSVAGGVLVLAVLMLAEAAVLADLLGAEVLRVVAAVLGSLLVTSLVAGSLLLVAVMGTSAKRDRVDA